eukprot:2246302-Prymnesium_polylepis.1
MKHARWYGCRVAFLKSCVASVVAAVSQLAPLRRKGTEAEDCLVAPLAVLEQLLPQAASRLAVGAAHIAAQLEELAVRAGVVSGDGREHVAKA